MQGNFEKKVQEKLEELKLTPSAPLWEKIELEIKVEKKRRRGLLWIPLILLLLAGGGAWLWQQRGEKAEGPVSTATPANPLPATSETTEASLTEIEEGKEKAGKKIDDKFSSGATETLGKTLEKKEPVFTPAPGSIVALSAKQKTAQRNIQDNGRSENGFTADEKRQPPVLKETAEKATVVSPAENKTTVTNEIISGLDSTTAALPAPADTASALLSPAEKKPEAVKTDTLAAKPRVAALPSKKWKLTFSVQAGWSSPAPHSGTAASDVNTPPLQNSGGGFSNNSAYPNQIGRGTAYALALGLEKNLGRRWQVAMGLQYAVFQTQSRVGSFSNLDTTLRFQSRMLDVGGYYRNGNLQAYTTRMHIIELPVSIGYQVLPSLPLTLTVGASYGRLLKSNALTFDRSSNVYYENKQNLKRHQAAVFSSLQYAVINKASFGLRAGPMVQYQLSSFQRETGTASRQLFFAGLKTTVQF